MKTVTVQAQVSIPMVPNFLKTESGSMPLSAFYEEDLRRIAEAWTEALIANWKRQRQQLECKAEGIAP